MVNSRSMQVLLALGFCLAAGCAQTGSDKGKEAAAPVDKRVILPSGKPLIDEPVLSGAAGTCGKWELMEVQEVPTDCRYAVHRTRLDTCTDKMHRLRLTNTCSAPVKVQWSFVSDVPCGGSQLLQGGANVMVTCRQGREGATGEIRQPVFSQP